MKGPRKHGVAYKNRTCNPQLRRLVLYPVELTRRFGLAQPGILRGAVAQTTIGTVAPSIDRIAPET